MLEGKIEPSKRLNLLYDYMTRYYHVIGNLTAAMAKRYVCKACGKGVSRNITHTCDETCSNCMASPPSVSTWVGIPCADWDRHFRSQECFANHKKRIGNKKLVCERKRKCGTCGELVLSDKKHELGKRYCNVSNANIEVGHLCYRQPLKNQATDYNTKSTILKRRRIHGTPIPLKCTFLIWYAYNSSVRDARAWTMSDTNARSVLRRSTRSGRIR